MSDDLELRIGYLEEEIIKQDKRLKKYEAANMRTQASFYQNNGIYQGLKIALAIMKGRTKTNV